MTLDAEIGRHAREKHSVDAPLAQLEDQVVGLRTIDLVRAHDDRLAVLDVGLAKSDNTPSLSWNTISNPLNS